jgi:hypothetical protein
LLFSGRDGNPSLFQVANVYATHGSTKGSLFQLDENRRRLDRIQ